ncbi:hypothetical protein PG994_005220 [Apiospora phragmitis]|uniref:Uncharacterized protein n=1 Tax=Apiospora phragmitis TaxID=2905665 RepID=A0ABR1VSV0_9PEZI
MPINSWNPPSVAGLSSSSSGPGSSSGAAQSQGTPLPPVPGAVPQAAGLGKQYPNRFESVMAQMAGPQPLGSISDDPEFLNRLMAPVFQPAAAATIPAPAPAPAQNPQQPYSYSMSQQTGSGSQAAQRRSSHPSRRSVHYHHWYGF